MKPVYLCLICVLFLAACGPVSTPPTTAATLQAGPAEGTQRLEACGFTVDYPSQLTPDGQGHDVMFLSNTDPGVSVFIQLRRRKAIESGVSLDLLALYLQTNLFPERSSLSFQPHSVKDVLGNTLPALQEDILQNDRYTRLMIFIRPDTLLADKRPADVIYELIGHAPQGDWSVWAPLFDAMFQSIQPRDCGGV